MTATVEQPAADAAQRPPQAAKRSVTRKHIGGYTVNSAGPWTYVAVVLITIISVFPLYYTFVMASHTNTEMAQKVPPFLPNHTFFSNVRQALKIAPLNKGLVNSLIVSGTVAIGTVAFCTLAGFAFAKLRFRGNGPLLAFCVATMMVPTQMGIIPLYMLMVRLHLANHLQAVILPSLVGAFGVFFMRQYIASAVPDELVEAGLVDGASTIRIFFSIIVPAARPAMAVLGMLTFLMSWNDFFWPIIALSSQNPTEQVAFQSLATGYAPQQSIIMAGTIYGTIPVLIVFALLGRQIVGGIMSGAVKG
jgi:cellobiose transport system permease protein